MTQSWIEAYFLSDGLNNSDQSFFIFSVLLIGVVLLFILLKKKRGDIEEAVNDVFADTDW